MKIQFDGHQQYQIDAVKAVVDLFGGQPYAAGQFEMPVDAGFNGLATELGFGNKLWIDWETIVRNLERIQKRHRIKDATLYNGMEFSIEMETGTGKTYVYLRTIHELYAKYGFSKFIVVVPSVAIREGVWKNLEITRSHFDDIYGRHSYDYGIYDSKRLSTLRQFATSNRLQVLVINLDAFNKKTNNVIYRENDRLSGHKPIEFIQSTHPIVILDEPQNMETTLAKEAIFSLNPLCTLRYSATHRQTYNLLYRLGPVQAYEMKLVKRIEVDSVIDAPDFHRPFIRVESIMPSKTKITARLTIDVQGKNGPSRKTVPVSKNGTDLYDVSHGKDAYRGYIVDHIDAGHGYVAFTNGVVLHVGQTAGISQDDVMRVQIYETVKEHLEKELKVFQEFPEGKRVKVLSLFFIDRVANYKEAEGKIKKWFEEAYTQLAQASRYAVLQLPRVDKVHNGYFATDKKGQAKDTSGTTSADDEAYRLIMKDKERLLSRDEPLRFIFSHSALREGWDNPNVFQICTLNETRSEMKKRQEIGRGLRLPVDETGNRIIDHPINRLTVIANESYEKFARALQAEIEEETGDRFPKPDDKRARRMVRRRSDLPNHRDFVELWNRIKHKTRYTVEYETPVLIRRAAEAIRSMAAVTPPPVQVVKTAVHVTQEGVTTNMLSVRQEAVAPSGPVPDLIGYLQRQTELTRSTIAEILISSGRLRDVFVNPQQFLDLTTRAIQDTLKRLIIQNIKYELSGQEYEMLKRLQGAGGFDEELDLYEGRLMKVDKSVYDHIEIDSDVEREFATALETRHDIAFYIKLPRWFKVDTPVGSYNPDWAVVKNTEEGSKLYLVRETKGSGELRESEKAKIHCARAHFQVLGVDYAVANSALEI